MACEPVKQLGRDYISDQAVISKILSTLPPRFRHPHSAWDSVPRNEQTIESLTLRLLKEESRNKVQEFMENEEERAFFSSRGPTSNSGRRLISVEEKRKHAAKITELKKKTKCQRCGKHGHWERECPNGKKEGDFDKPNEKINNNYVETRKGEAHAVITEDLDEGESSVAFMVNVDECSDDNAWYMDGGAIDHMTDRLDWFATFKPVSQRRWPVMIADNWRLWVRGVGCIQIQCEVNGSWYPRDIHRVLYVPELRKNLFSVGQAADKGFITTYTRHSCFLTSNEGQGKVVLTGTHVNKLYKLALIVNRPNIVAHIATSRDTNKRRSTTRQRDTPSLHLTLLHQRFGHVKHAMLVYMHAHNTVQGMTLPQHTMPGTPCEGCAVGKNARQHFPKIRSSPRAEKPGLFFHTDVCGPMSQASLGQARYFLLYKDDFSGYRFVYCIKHKSDVLDCFKKLCKLVPQQTGNHIQKIRSDRGGEFLGGEFVKFLADSNICHELTSPYTPKQNGCAERENRTLVECVHTMLHSKQLNLNMWGEAIQTAANHLNRTASRTRSHKTPHDLWTCHVHTVSHLRVFGYNAYAHIPKVNRRKLDPKSIKTIFVGYCTHTKAYRLWDTKRQKMLVSRDVIFYELSIPGQTTPEVFLGLFSFQDVAPRSATTNIIGDSQLTPLHTTTSVGLPASALDHAPPIWTSPEATTSDCHDILAPVDVPSCVSPAHHTTCPPRASSPRPMRVRSAPSHLRDYIVPPAFAGLAASVHIPDDPDTYAEAIANHESFEWCAAMETKYDSLLKNGTWRLVPLPPDRKHVKCKWVYRVKTHSDGTVAKFKARLVAKGFTQQHGVDYGQTFSHVVRYESIRIVFAIVAQQKMKIVQFDIQTAFLHGILDVLIYMMQPQGFEVTSSTKSQFVCLLLKSLYGLKQSGHIWNKIFDDFLIKFALTPTEVDPCVYISQAEPKLIVTFLVDDGLACCSSPTRLEELVQYMEEHFAMTGLCADLYVGLHICQLPTEGQLFIHQAIYLRRILARFGFTDCTPLNTSADPNVKLDHNNYGDADYASDITFRKSRTGTILLLNGAPVAWCNRKQNCVATFTTESEYIAAGSTTKDIIWHRRLLSNFRFDQPHATRLFSDN